MAKWIYRRLNKTWTNARHVDRAFDRRGTLYDIGLNELANSSGYLEHELIKHRRAKLIMALDELKDNCVIEKYEQHNVIENDDGRPIDYIFRLYATQKFVQEQISANKRAKKIAEMANKVVTSYIAS